MFMLLVRLFSLYLPLWRAPCATNLDLTTRYLIAFLQPRGLPLPLVGFRHDALFIRSASNGPHRVSILL
jgi:hypothetical protein